MNARKIALGMEVLEGRTLPSMTNPWGWWSVFSHPDAAVQADLAKIKTDEQALQTEITTLAPTLKADEKALQTAIKSAISNDPTVQTAEATLKTDSTTWAATLKSDWEAIQDAKTSTARQAAFAQLKTDLSSAATALKADHTAVQTAINDDSGVATAQAKLTSDSAPITADKARSRRTSSNCGQIFRPSYRVRVLVQVQAQGAKRPLESINFLRGRRTS